MILGAATYLSPEQARGRPTERRADIWAFGVVLYELLAGRSPFAGEDVTEIVAAVVKTEPDLTVVPARVRRLLRSCLEKDPKKRLQAIGDTRLLLEEPPATGASVPARRPFAWMAATGIAALTALAVGFVHLREAFGGGNPIPLVQAPSTQTHAQLSPDNRWLAYASGESGRLDVYVQPFSTDGKAPARRWPVSTGGGTDPRWSRDGKELFYLAADQKLVSVAIKLSGADFSFDAPKPLFELAPLTGTVGTGSFRYAVSFDGKRFLVLEDAKTSGPTPITVITSWRALLAKNAQKN